jgi:proline iminopeptidase
MDVRFPEIEPYASGMLDVGDGHQIYWEACGNPAGKPALYLHGGPGTGFSPGQRRFFDPDAYRVILFDQRGSKRSRPLASDTDADLSANTTAHLIADIERLREMHEVDRWVILGLSWGTTLALAYAQSYPQHVAALVLGLVTTTSRGEVEWITQDMRRIFPREWQRFYSTIPESLRHLRPVDAYARMLFDPDLELRDLAAREWCNWEDTHISLAPGHTPDPRYEDPEFRLRFARLVTHYWSNAAFLEEEQLLRNAATLNGIPGVLIHGRYDVSSPLEIAWRLAQDWTSSRLYVMDDAGHGGDSLIDYVVSSLNEFAGV